MGDNLELARKNYFDAPHMHIPCIMHLNEGGVGASPKINKIISSTLTPVDANIF